MANISAKVGLQKHEKELKALEGRIDQMHELMAKNLEQTSTQIGVMGDQISQINHRLQTTSEEIAQKITEAFETFHRLEKEKSTAAEVHTPTSNSATSSIPLEPPQPLSPSTNLLPPLQFGTTTTFFCATNIFAPILNHCPRLGTSIQNQHSIPFTPYTQVSSIVSVPEAAVRTLVVTLTSPNTIRLPSYTTSMLGWHPYSDASCTMGTTVPMTTTNLLHMPAQISQILQFTVCPTTLQHNPYQFTLPIIVSQISVHSILMHYLHTLLLALHKFLTQYQHIMSIIIPLLSMDHTHGTKLQKEPILDKLQTPFYHFPYLR